MQVDTVSIRTAENVGIGYEVAGLATRLLAFLLDMVLVGIIAFCAILGWTALVAITGGDGSVVTAVGLVLIALLGLLCFFGYFTVLEATSAGRTPGKRALALRVVCMDGSAPGLREALVRNLVRIIDLPVGLFVMFFHSSSRRLGDLAAGTMVVREQRAAAALQQAASPVITRTPDAGPDVDGMDRLGAAELDVLRAFLSRPGMDAERRGEMALRISARLLDRMGLPADAPERRWPPELFLERLYLQLGRRLAAQA